MAPPSGTAEAVKRIHAAITVLDPDLAPPLPENPTDDVFRRPVPEGPGQPVRWRARLFSTG